MSETKKSEGIGRLILVLGLITFVCALLLGVVNQVTAPLIEQNEINTRNAAMEEIIPGAQFEDLGTILSAEEVAAAGVTLPAAEQLRQSLVYIRQRWTDRTQATAYRSTRRALAHWPWCITRVMPVVRGDRSGRCW